MTKVDTMRECGVTPERIAIKLYNYGFSVEWLRKASVRQMYAVAKAKGLI